MIKIIIIKILVSLVLVSQSSGFKYNPLILPGNYQTENVFVWGDGVWYNRKIPFKSPTCVCSYESHVFVGGYSDSTYYFANSSDFGVTWSRYNLNSKTTCNSCLALSKEIIYNVGDEILYSNNGGRTWKVQESSDNRYNSVIKMDNNLMAFGMHFEVGDFKMVVAETIINGAKWKNKCWPFYNDKNPFGVASYGSNIAIAVDNSGLYYMSNDNGETWRQRDLPNNNTPLSPTAIISFNGNILLSQGSSLTLSGLSLSTDNGYSFQWIDASALPKLLLPIKYVYDDINDILYASTAYSSYTKPNVYGSRDNGKTWYEITVKE